ncbi:phage head morphogenesis protein [Methylorubrum extorquens]|uniref:phage head morphogenesis protein n=1 Tax=Methylorubrum extorquens TaxID=408 RepID=UPI002237E658|nr:phage head morphogenesis protein [Methylorubrum extorquens]UYW34463.1 phage head morphogenesis protein [Methylorubrum extorquens]
MAVNDDIMDAQVSHAVGLQRLGTSILRKILALLNRTDADLEDQIRQRLAGVEPGSIETEFTTERLRLLLEGIRRTNAAVYDQIQVVLLQEALGLAEYEAEHQASIITEHVPVRLDVALPTTEQLHAIVQKRPFQGRLLREWGKSLEDGRTQKVHDAVRIGMVEGETVDHIVRRVRGTKAMEFKDGVLEISRRDAEAVVRTAVAHIANGASEATYERNADIIKGVRWVSVLDSRTTAVCRARDGKVYEPGKGPRPPAHWNCRSTTTPVTKSFRDLGIDLDEVPAGTRASMDGQVPADLTYGGWLARQSAAVQDDILGATKGKLFRDGGLTVDRFVDRAGREYTLDELQRRERGAFRKAGLAA